MGQLDGRVALITGGGEGIGRGLAAAYLKQGAKVVVAEYNDALGQETAKTLASETGGEIVHIVCDVTKKEQIQGAVAETVSRFGTIDILVNNAWSGGEISWVERKLNGVNAHMGSTEYNSAKEALRALTRTAAREWAGYGIVANIICPGAKSAASERVFAQNPELLVSAEAANPMGRMGDAEGDIGPVAVFLASAGASYLTGNTLYVDGGSHINGSAWAPDLPE